MPKASFTTSSTGGTAPASIFFTNTSTGFENPTFKWRFGDDSTSTLENPEHVYLASGNYPVQLTVTDQGTSYVSEVVYIGISVGKPAVSQQITPIYQGVTFLDSAGDLLVGGQLWFYTQGSNSNLQTTYGSIEKIPTVNPNPMVINAQGRLDSPVYLKSGCTYNIVLTQADGETVISRQDGVTAPVIAAGDHVYLTPMTGTGAVTINSIFPDTLKGHGATNLWYVKNQDFIFGTSYLNYVRATRKLPLGGTTTPDVDFDQNQSCLVFNRAGSYTITATYLITPSYYWPGNVTVYSTRISNIDPKLPTTPRDVSVATRNSDGWGDSFDIEQQQQSLTNTWTVTVAQGQRVTLDYLINRNNHDASGTIQGWVAVNRIGEAYTGVTPPPPIELPVASFTQDFVQEPVPFTVTFTDTSIGNPTSWAWDFGDGSTSSVQNPTHEYIIAGDYTVTLTVANANGSSQPFLGYVYAQTAPAVPPIASFVPTSGQGYTPFSVTFTDTSQNTPTSWAWFIDNVQVSTEQNPTILFDVPQQLPYEVLLRVSNDAGTSTAQGQYTAWGGADWGIVPIPSFIYETAEGPNPTNLTVYFVDTSYGRPTGWFWDFGDGLTSTEQNPIHVYESLGTFQVAMSASNVFGTSPTPATAEVEFAETWRITFRDNSGATLPIFVDTPGINNGPMYGIPVSRDAVAELVSKLTGLLWTLNGNTVPAYFDAQPEPETTDNFVSILTSYCYMENNGITGRRLYLQGQKL